VILQGALDAERAQGKPVGEKLVVAGPGHASPPSTEEKDRP
jgi:hypothetical protein